MSTISYLVGRTGWWVSVIYISVHVVEEEVLVENGDERIDACTAGGASLLVSCCWSPPTYRPPVLAAILLACQT
ncbi:hypothetical protein T12_4843 [Trichinella patagoniensis]|uniref:Uncharacterized protein n=1 Tax=Trichinella patagoniensis TaxID=990121 RepID=A0A0V1ACL0_9BILA|nr:hypothetical protein T12_4843 [Trichinella patagoniensis]